MMFLSARYLLQAPPSINAGQIMALAFYVRTALSLRHRLRPSHDRPTRDHLKGYAMEYRLLGRSGLKVPVLSFGAATFAGKGPLFGAWGDTGVEEARRLIDICLEAGVTLFDTADVYSNGASEEALGAALKGRRGAAFISTKTGLPMGDGPNDAGSSRLRLVRAVEDALKRLDTDYIDLLQLHAFDAATPMEEVLSTLDMLVRDGKIRYVGVSNFSGWQIMKALSIADRFGWPRYVANQVYYSLIGRDYEWDLMPLGADQGLGALVWSPLGWGRLTGKIRRGAPLPEKSRLHDTASYGPPVEEERLFRVVDALEAVAAETGKTVPQVALDWLIQRPTVSSVIIGARNEEQLRENLGAVGWTLSPGQIAELDGASLVAAPYPHFPYRRQEGFARINPPMAG
jgi:aryl-alcohol dehydrogenase-like predicted oxidoreductase